jgi:hypothetical protein
VQALLGQPLVAFLAMAAITALGLPLVLFLYPAGETRQQGTRPT